MTTVFRIVRLFALAIWVGGLVFFGFVAAVAFKTLPDVSSAGAVVRGSLIALHHIGLAAGMVYLLFTLALLATQRDTHPIRAAELVAVLAMLVLTGYSEFSVIPRMEADRASLGGDITKAPMDAPAREHFERLHNVSVRVEGAVLIVGLVLLGMAPVHGRDDFDRFA
jgi:putative copper export protein